MLLGPNKIRKMSTIENLVNSHMTVFFQQINQRYSVPVSELDELWRAQIGQLGNAVVVLLMKALDALRQLVFLGTLLAI